MITIGWKNGAWKGTLTKKLADHFWYEVISIGNIKRALATEMGITILEFDQIGRNNPEKAREHDLKYEEYQESLDPTSPIILDSRLSFMCQPKAFNVFLDVTDEAGAKRIFEHQRKDEENESYETVLEANNTRHQWQYDAYIKLYNTDLFDAKNYDLLIDTTAITPDKVFDTVIKAFETWKSQ